MELDFAGKGLTVVLLTLCPQFSEAGMVCLAGHFIFGIPWALAGAMGFVLAAVSPAVVVPAMMILHEAKYGVAKGIPTTLIAASSFDDIFGITFFGLLSTVAFQQRDLLAAEEIVGDGVTDVEDVAGDVRMLSESSDNLWLLVGTNVF
jgi:NhaP-type Na+/H+ or K+/H+ antiporter